MLVGVMYNNSFHGTIDSFDVDQIFVYVKNIFDCNRCAICDKEDGSRMRYPCGHTACDECVSLAEGCLICLTSPQTPTSNKPVQDGVFMKRVQNAANLLESCQNYMSLNIDVLRKQRMSEQLKAEKQVFPNCIQAPVKYCNKRKSLITSSENKSKRLSSFPGEQVSFNEMKMEKSSNSVHAWLDKHEKTVSRKPFGDINVNQQIRKTAIQPINKTRLKDKVKENITNEMKTKQKRFHRKPAQFTFKSQSCLKSTYELESIKLQNDNEKKIIHNVDESGIVMDDETIIIDDSQSQFFDKDKEAWLAVLEAEKKNQDGSVSIARLDSSEDVTCTNELERTHLRTNDINNEKNHIKVPFYKKSYMLETCLLCSSNYNKNEKSNKSSTRFNDNVSITIESNTLITTIHVSNAEQTNQKRNQQSVLVQTDICLTDELKNHRANEDSIMIKGNKLKTNVETKQFSSSLTNSNRDNERGKNVLTNDVNITDKCLEENVSHASNKSVNKKECVVIDESDSDLESSGGVHIEVSAQIHRSCELSDYGVLSEVLNHNEQASRKRRNARGFTPTSTDSSEKENFNPNRAKKTKFGKKDKKWTFH